MNIIKWMIVFISPWLFFTPVYARVIPMQFFTHAQMKLPGEDPSTETMSPVASGSGTYDDNSEKPSFSLTFQNLIPNALYTVWCSNVRLPTTVLDSRPCGAMDWSNDTFRTDSLGNGTVYTPLPSPFPPSTDKEATMVSVVYERDGRTHNDTNIWGVTSHPQFMYFYPSFESAKQELTNQISPWWTVGILGMLTLGTYAIVQKFLG